MTRIKICGLTTEEDIRSINEARPDYCGFIVEYLKSRRNVSKDQVERLVRLLEPEILPVGVFVNAPPFLPAKMANEGTIRAIQLHGQEDAFYLQRLRKLTDAPVIQAFSIATEKDVEAARRSEADWVLLDHGSGGTGESFDWNLIKNMERPFFLAGGLTPENLVRAVHTAKPWAVDLSSGVEKNGRKDAQKIRAAVEAVRKIKG